MKDVKVAVVQDSPVLFNKGKTIEKIRALSRGAAKESAELVLFPEAFIPAYPRGLSFGTVVGSRTNAGRELWQKYYDNSIEVGDKGFNQLGEIAKEFGVILVIGVTEKVRSGTLYCSMLYFDKSGKLIGRHRKLKPTAAERVIWGEGDGSDLEVYDTEAGNIGGLICWENYMPLARTWLYQQAVEIYCAPTADQRGSWQSTMRHIATEGRCYVLGCNQFVTRADYPQDLPGEEVSRHPEILSRGGSLIVDPLGEVIAGPLWDKAGILYAKLSASKLKQAKMDFDPVGHYARDDVFELKIRS